MNERLPYEEQLLKHWNDLQLPDENLSWEDMKRRLEEDNDDGVIIPPAKKGCLGYGLLLTLFAIILFFVARPDKWTWNKKEKNIDSSGVVKSANKDVYLKNQSIYSQKNIVQPETLIILKKDSDSSPNKSIKEAVTKDSLLSIDKKVIKQKKLVSKRNAEFSVSKSNGHVTLTETNTEDQNNNYKKTYPINKKFAGKLKSKISGDEQNVDSVTNNKENPPAKIGTLQNEENIKPDSISKREIKKIDTTSKILKQDSIVKKQIYFAAGIALHQQVPVNGQKLAPYNSLGRKSTLGDYIPSIYFRMHQGKKWFIQSEFRYGAPQTNREILYKQQKLVDSNNTLTTSNRLKKTYYHQLPVSFNYFIITGFSVGAGFTWNRFSSAVIDQEVKLTNNITLVDSFKTYTILHSQKTDSNFVKSYLQALFETQYKWKRFSIGARYSFGLQPFIKFQLPGGERREEKNSSLQLFIRYNLWESKRK